jgi:DNA-binding CsgD family transcriptional regulator
MRLSQRDFDSFCRTLLILQEPRNLEAFKEALPGILLKIIECDYCTWASYTLGKQPKMSAYSESEQRMTPEIIFHSEEQLVSHPFTAYYAKSNDVTALRSSDFMNVHELKKTLFWQRVLKPLEVNYMFGIPTNPMPGEAAGLTLCSKSRDFTERDRLVLNLLRPHILQAVRTASLITGLQQAKKKVPDDAWLRQAYGLSPRESEIVRWVVEGKSNSEISIILRLSRRTVEKHMENILAKLAVENRTTAVAMLASSLQSAQR